MKILRNAGYHKILAIMDSLDLAEGPLELIEKAGRTAYQSRDKICAESPHKFVRSLIEQEHESVLEHSAMTVEFNNVSRGFTHELVRHRLCAFTQESTRYVDESNFEVVVPPHQKNEIPNGEFVASTFLTDWFKDCKAMYEFLRKAGWPAQDARQVLPIAIKSQIVCTANFREWRHIFKLRTAMLAHWEIRRVMIQLLADVQGRIPVVFDDIVPEYTQQEAKDWDWKGQEWFESRYNE